MKQECIDIEVQKTYRRYNILNKKYGYNFWFTDSLINGSIKNYKRLVDTLNELIDKGELSGIRYGYFRTHKKMGEEF